MQKIHLVRFFDNEEYAKSFLDGEISMNYLGAYWGPDLDRLREEKRIEKWNTKKITPAKYGQDDMYEGAVALLKNDVYGILPEVVLQHCIGNVILRVEAYRYCNLLCMCAIDYDEEKGTINLPDKDYFRNYFGEYAVVIQDTSEFIRRVNQRLLTTGHIYIYGRVEYIDILGDSTLMQRHSAQVKSDILSDGFDEALEKGRMIDVFEKDKLLRNQNEWRLCVYRGVRDEDRYFMPPLGSLKDIAQLVPTVSLNTFLLKKHPGLKCSFQQTNSSKRSSDRVICGGNITRSDFQTLMCRNKEYSLLFNIG